MSFAIGIINTKFNANLGSLIRSADCFGASAVFSIGKRYDRSCADTNAAYRNMPVMHFDSWRDWWPHLPFDWQPVAIELCEGAISLADFHHPERATYILGPEDGSVPRELLDKCRLKVQVPTKYCLNVATAGAIVMYDRIAKQKK